MEGMSKTYLFVPGNSEKKILRAISSTADAVIIDLEDAVIPEEKEKARTIVYDMLKDKVVKKQIYIRVNSCQTTWWKNDLALTKKLPQLQGIMLPKSESAQDIDKITTEIFENHEIIPLIESAKGVHNFDQIVMASRQIKRVAFGSVDFALDLNVEWTEEGTERLYAMGKICLQSRALGLEPPIDAVFPILDQQQAFEKDILLGKKIGFFGKLIIHPKQIESVHTLYAPSKEKILWSEQIIQLFENKEHGGAVTLDGKLIDLPIYLLAKRLLANSV